MKDGVADDQVIDLADSKSSSRGDRIRSERLRLGLTVVDFASGAGVSKGSELLYEKGKPPTADYLVKVDAIGGDILYIVTGRRRAPMPTVSDMSAQRQGWWVLPVLAASALFWGSFLLLAF